MDKRCVCCEKPHGGLGFVAKMNTSDELSTHICMDCVVLGARWIVKQARTELEEENYHQEHSELYPALTLMGFFFTLLFLIFLVII